VRVGQIADVVDSWENAEAIKLEEKKEDFIKNLLLNQVKRHHPPTPRAHSHWTADPSPGLTHPSLAQRFASERDAAKAYDEAAVLR